MFFKKSSTETKNTFLVKVCALLIHAAKIDQNYTETEEEIIKKTLLGMGAKNETKTQTIKEDKYMLLTMALFKNYIMSNSTFYWWGSFLSIYDKPKIITADKWIFDTEDKKRYWSIYRKDMEIIERPVEID